MDSLKTVRVQCDRELGLIGIGSLEIRISNICYKINVYTHKKIISRVRNTLSLSNFLYVQRRVKSLNEENAFLKWQYAICFSNLSRNLLIDTVDIESDLK